MSLANIMLDEKKSDTKEDIPYDFTAIKCPEQANPQGQKVDWGGQGLRVGRRGVTAHGYEASFLGACALSCLKRAHVPGEDAQSQLPGGITSRKCHLCDLLSLLHRLRCLSLSS